MSRDLGEADGRKADRAACARTGRSGSLPPAVGPAPGFVTAISWTTRSAGQTVARVRAFQSSAAVSAMP